MEPEKYYCYICGQEITETNKTDEHIILNAIGGHLHSYTVICKDCNNRMGETADARLAEDLSFYTDMLKVKKNRQNHHNQVMKDEDGHEVIVEDGGRSLSLRRPYMVIDKKDDVKTVHLTARNAKELGGLLNGLVKNGELTQEQVDDIISKAKVTEHNPILSKQTVISSEAFPSVIKSAAIFYVDRTHDIASVKQLVPYIEGKGDSRDVLYLYHFKTLPYSVKKGQVTHMIHIEGSKDTGLLFAMMEYYSIYVYIVVIDRNYTGDNINMTYAYDVVSGQEIRRDFSVPLTMKNLEDFRDLPYEEYVKYLPFIEQRANSVMAVWEKDSDQEELHDVIDKAFGRYPEGCMLTPEMLEQISQDIMGFYERKIVRSFKLKGK